MKIRLKEAFFGSLIDSGFSSVRPEVSKGESEAPPFALRYLRANVYKYFLERGLEEYSGLDTHHFHHPSRELVLSGMKKTYDG